MASKNYEVVLDFLVNLKSDKKQVEQIAKSIEEIVGKASPELNMNDDDVKAGVRELVVALSSAEKGADDLNAALNALNLDLDTEEAQRSLKEIESIIEGISKTKLGDSLGVDLDPVEADIRDFEEAMKKIDLGDLDRDVLKFAEAFDKARLETEQMVNANQKALAAMKMSGKEGTEAYESLEKQLKEASARLKEMDEAANSLNDFDKVVKTSAVSASTFAERMATFGNFTQGVEQITSTLDRFQQPFIELDKQVRNIGTLGVKNFQEFSDKAIELSRTVPDSAGEIAGAVYDAIGAGAIKTVNGIADAASGMKFVETASKLAVAGATSTASAVQGLASIMNAYKEETQKVGEYSDVMNNVVNAGVTSIEELNASMSGVIPTASALGVPFKQVGGAIATMTKLGVPTSQSITKINAALSELAKPGADLAPIMKAAGVSLESLKAEGLQVTMKKLGEELSRTGKQAVQVFGSIEAAGAVMTLSGENAQMAAEDYEFVANTMGSTEAAYALASEGIGNKTKVLMNNIQAGFNYVLQSMGSVGQMALATATQVAPLITSFAGLSQVIPQDAGKKVADLGKSLLTKLAPGLMGAKTAQDALNTSILLNPYVLAIAGIAALVTSLHFLSDALHETAVERAEDLKGEQDLAKSRMETNNQQRALVKSNLDLVDSFKSQGASAMQNQTMLMQLAKTYPGVIDQNKSYAENLAALEKAAGKSRGELNNLDKDMQQIAEQQIQLNVKLAATEIDISKEGIEDELTDAFGGIRDSIQEWVFGTSNARMDSEEIVKPYTDALYAAKNDKELQKASLDFQMAVYNDPKFAELDDKQKQKVIEGIKKMTAAKKKYMEESKRGLEEDLRNFQNMGYNQNDIITLLAKKYGKSKDEIAAMIKKQQESKDKAKEQTEGVKSLADAWGEVKKGVDEALQKQNSEAMELLRRSRDMSLSQKERDAAAAAYKEELKSLTQKANQSKELADIEKQVKIDSGQEAKEKKKSTKEGKTALEQAREAAQLESAKLDVTMQQYEYAQKLRMQQEGRKEDSFDELALAQKQLDTTTAQLNKWVEILKEKKVISEIDANGKIVFGASVKDVEKPEVEKLLLDLNSKILDSKNKVQDIKVKIGTDEESLRAADEKLKELENQKIEWEVSIGVRPQVAFENVIQEYKDKATALLNQVSENDAKIAALNKEMEEKISQVSGEGAEQEIQAIRQRYGEKVKVVKEKNVELLGKEFEVQKRIHETEESYYAKRLEDLKKFEADKLTEIEGKFDREKQVLDRFNALWAAASEKRDAIDKEKATSGVDDEMEKRLADLEDYKEKEYISAEEFEARKEALEENARRKKEQIEEEYRRRKLRQDAEAKGLEIELQRQHDERVLTLQRDSVSQQLDVMRKKAKEFDAQGNPIFDSSADKAAYEALQKQLTDTEDLLQTKGSTVSLMAEQLQGTVTDYMTNMFAGDPQAAADSWRAFFSQLAGMLQKKAQAMVLGMILSEGTMKYLEALPFPGNVLAIPVITGFVNAAVKGLTDPIIQSILAFPTGAIFEKPTLALVGDGARLGGPNREYLLRDSQLIATVQMAANMATTGLLAEFKKLAYVMGSQRLEATLAGRDMKVALNRTNYHESGRAR